MLIIFLKRLSGKWGSLCGTHLTRKSGKKMGKKCKFFALYLILILYRNNFHFCKTLEPTINKGLEWYFLGVLLYSVFFIFVVKLGQMKKIRESIVSPNILLSQLHSGVMK